MNRLCLIFMLLISMNASAFFTNRDQELQQLKEQLHAVAKKISDINEQIRQKEELIFQLREKITQRSRKYWQDVELYLRQIHSDEKLVIQSLQELKEADNKKLQEKEIIDFIKEDLSEDNVYRLLLLNMVVEIALLKNLIEQLNSPLVKFESLSKKIKDLNK